MKWLDKKGLWYYYWVPKLSTQGKRHEFIKHFGTTKTWEDLFFFFFSLDEKLHLASLSFWAVWCLLCTLSITHHVYPESWEEKPITLCQSVLLKIRFAISNVNNGVTNTATHTWPPVCWVARTGVAAQKHGQQMGGQPWVGQGVPHFTSVPKTVLMNSVDTSLAKEHHW